jgi:hypothetical protein
MSTIRNTTEDWDDATKAPIFVGLGQGGTPELSAYIEHQEAAGQAQLVKSHRLPVKSDGDEAYIALGFTFGEPDRGDGIFRPATLPPGWSRKPTDHSMWSKFVDELGRERVAIFYKAAFYDRSAHMHRETPHSYLRSALYYDTPVVLDEVWLSRDIAREELEAIAASEDEDAAEADEYAKGGDEYWTKQGPEHRARAAKARALAATL